MNQLETTENWNSIIFSCTHRYLPFNCFFFPSAETTPNLVTMPDNEMMNDEYYTLSSLRLPPAQAAPWTCSWFTTKEKRTVIDPDVKRNIISRPFYELFRCYIYSNCCSLTVYSDNCGFEFETTMSAMSECFLSTQSVQLFGGWQSEQQCGVSARHRHLSVQRIRAGS